MDLRNAIQKRAAAVADEGPWYHGTRHPLQPGQMLTVPTSHPKHFDAMNHVFMTKDRSAAQRFAEGNFYFHEGSPHGQDDPPKVYQVEPTGPYDQDPLFHHDGRTFRTKHPVRVIGEA